MMADAEAGEETAPLWVWIGLSLIAAMSFWFQATVTEEYFVPALNVIADGFGIPDDSAYQTHASCPALI